MKRAKTIKRSAQRFAPVNAVHHRKRRVIDVEKGCRQPGKSKLQQGRSLVRRQSQDQNIEFEIYVIFRSSADDEFSVRFGYHFYRIAIMNIDQFGSQFQRQSLQPFFKREKFFTVRRIFQNAFHYRTVFDGIVIKFREGFSHNQLVGIAGVDAGYKRRNSIFQRFFAEPVFEKSAYGILLAYGLEPPERLLQNTDLGFQAEEARRSQ